LVDSEKFAVEGADYVDGSWVQEETDFDRFFLIVPQPVSRSSMKMFNYQ